MEIVITKGERDDRVSVTRADGTRAETRFPHKGPVPHDAVHYFVERGVGLLRGFWGMVAEGTHPEQLAALASAGGHASASRARTPDPSIVELVQAERIVECFEAELWSAGCDNESLRSMAAAGCEGSFVPLPALEPEVIAHVRDSLTAFSREWVAAPIGHAATLHWDER